MGKVIKKQKQNIKDLEDIIKTQNLQIIVTEGNRCRQNVYKTYTIK
jgi:hypothetical protein